ncbi:DUF2947 family protein [Echinimonas agarilytica]|uniref:DUF2947 domain-containing protein n=1 Tax=Echinimonas agarilytica TaxID=1215918 RepID=A0AA41W8B9_9GAMM|nr:DUF2947 family protein [Echinimonas agarilytica]MCM2680286.1 DUF2947 domain-containing protein [Echinimonas agarilytica]
MNYMSLDDLKNAWIFRHNSLPIEASDRAAIKPFTEPRANQLWDTFVSKQVDHPDFFKQGDWAFNNNTWKDSDNWESTWDSDDPALPELIQEHLNWDINTVVYYCVNRKYVIECRWEVFQRCWKNFLFMDDGALLIGKRRDEVVQFSSDGTFKIGQKGR